MADRRATSKLKPVKSPAIHTIAAAAAAERTSQLTQHLETMRAAYTAFRDRRPGDAAALHEALNQLLGHMQETFDRLEKKHSVITPLDLHERIEDYLNASVDGIVRATTLDAA